MILNLYTRALQLVAYWPHTAQEELNCGPWAPTQQLLPQQLL